MSTNNRIPTTESDRRKKRLLWACLGLGLLNLIALLLLIFLPYDCVGREEGRHEVITDTVEKRTVVIERIDTVREPAPPAPQDSTEEASEIDEAVEDAGGNINGFMRFSIMWNQDGRDMADLDAHAIEPGNREISFEHYKGHNSPAGGQLDVDMIRPNRNGVENIVYESASTLKDGNYRFFIVNYDGGQNRRCDVQLKVGNQTFNYRVSNIGNRQKKNIATVTISNHAVADIQHSTTPSN